MTSTITDPATAPTVAPVVGKRARLRGSGIIPQYDEGWQAVWTASGAYTLGEGKPHPFDIIAILDDEAAPEPQAENIDHGVGRIQAPPKAQLMTETEVAEITGYRAGKAFFSAEDGRVMIHDVGADIVGLTPAEARALLQVLPGLIKIAEGR